MQKTVLIQLPWGDFETLLFEVVDRALKLNQEEGKRPFSDLPDLLTRRQTADLLGVSLPTIDNWSRSGRLKKHRLGRSIRYQKKEVLETLETHRVYRRD